MNKNNILNIIQKSKSFKLDEDSQIYTILEFLETFVINYNNILSNFETSKIRFCDYYDEKYSVEELINYFESNYIGNDLNEQKKCFIMYSIFQKSNYLLEALDLFGVEECLTDFAEDIKITNELIKNFISLNTILTDENLSDDLNFDNHKYKMLFAGHSFDDILYLDKQIVKSLVNKINLYLLESDTINGVEGVKHVNERYNVPLLRIHLANDYRIAFIRKNKFTIILGVELKNGKDSNYSRYDPICKKIETIYFNMDLLSEGKLPSDDIHYRTIELIRKKLNIVQNKHISI